MEIPRQNPDQLLRAIRNDTESKKRGKLKIFFGYAAGVGKTYAMLQAAHQAKANGTEVVAGYIEPHSRPQTSALLDGLEQLPVKQVLYGEMILREFDIDSALKRKPQLILVDELAHTNGSGSRHAKRYQDVQELLSAGIDVYTTVNVQHIESLNDTVASITGVLVREPIPDYVFDQADQVELVDIEPTELLERMASGNIYQGDQAERAAVNFFTVENLTALREIALRRCADRVNLLTESARIQSRGDYHTDEHILVCLSSSPSNAKIIRTAARNRLRRGCSLSDCGICKDFRCLQNCDRAEYGHEKKHIQQADADGTPDCQCAQSGYSCNPGCEFRGCLPEAQESQVSCNRCAGS